MSYIIVWLPVVLPILFWAGYHLHVDRHLPEPVGHLCLAFLLGVGSYYLGAMLYGALEFVRLRHDAFHLAQSSLPGLFAYSVLAIGVIEELVKIIPFMLIVLRFKEFDEPIDGIIYASFIALGFSAMENLPYLQFLDNREAYLRGFAGPVIHIVFASFWGYHIGRAYLRGESLLLGIVKGFLAAAVCHGLYDFIVLQNSMIAPPIAAVLIVAIWIWRLRLLRMLHEEAKSASASSG